MVQAPLAALLLWGAVTILTKRPIALAGLLRVAVVLHPAPSGLVVLGSLGSARMPTAGSKLNTVSHVLTFWIANS